MLSLSRLSGSGIVLWPVCGGKLESGGARGTRGLVPIRARGDEGGEAGGMRASDHSPLAKSPREDGFFFSKGTCVRRCITFESSSSEA